jgi:hypothetical protein
MTALGLPTILNVVLPSLIGDGVIDSAGGTVMDVTFGARAQVTLPAGAVTVPTDVAIDVLESPLTFPMPAGFSAPGTSFVNISFTPTPSMPFQRRERRSFCCWSTGDLPVRPLALYGGSRHR